jgi:hypothetical protein
MYKSEPKEKFRMLEKIGVALPTRTPVSSAASLFGRIPTLKAAKGALYGLGDFLGRNDFPGPA